MGVCFRTTDAFTSERHLFNINLLPHLPKSKPKPNQSYFPQNPDFVLREDDQPPSKPPTQRSSCQNVSVADLVPESPHFLIDLAR